MDHRLIKTIFLLFFTGSVSTLVNYNCDKQTVPCGCGYTNVETIARIANGEEAIPYSWSMVVSLRYDCLRNDDPTEHCCGGTILTDSYVLIAAHCVDMLNSSSLANVTIAAGIHRRSQQHLTIRKIDQIILHPNWTRNLFNIRHDIALLHLSEPLDLATNKYLAPTCRPPRLDRPEEIMQYPLNGTSLAVIGWGRFSLFNSSTPDGLRQATIYSIHHNHSTCAEVIHDNLGQFCAGLYGGGKAPCLGDSGGPILQWIGDRWEQVGIASYITESCGSPLYQSVFTRVAFYNDWIDSILLENNQTTTTRTSISTIGPVIPPPTQPPFLYRCNSALVSCGCGYNNVAISPSRIVGGEEAVPHSWSMMVSIRFGGSNVHECGGSILSESYILTAAHCVDEESSSSPDGLSIVAGIHNRSDGNAQVRLVDRIYVHPNYTGSSGGYVNDIAILYLSGPLDFATNRYIKRSCVPDVEASMDVQTYPANGTRLAAIGWGYTRQGDINSGATNLQQAEVFVIDNNDPICNYSIRNTQKQFCAGLYQGGKDDSGGPILQWMDNHWEQVGITSYGKGCAIEGYPGIYTRLAPYHEWIEFILNIHNQTLIANTTTTTTATVITEPPVTYYCNVFTVSCGCSRRDVELSPSRIVGGEDASSDSWTMVVSIGFDNAGSFYHHCGGSVLTESYILTAAECVQGFLPSDLSIAVNMHNRSSDSAVIHQVDHIHIHPNWIDSDGTYRNDIALLRISPPLIIDGSWTVARTCIPHVTSLAEIVDYPPNGTHLAIVGWGSVRTNTITLPEILQQASVYLIDNEDALCQRSIYDPEKQFCAGLYRGGKDPCQGDYGGPIMQWKGKYWEQVGITSNGGCGAQDRRAVFTRLAYYSDWIQSIMNGSSSNTTTSTPVPPIILPPIAYPCNRTASCGCGRTDVALTPTRIVGGEKAIDDSWSMIISLRRYFDFHACGGTMLSESFVLTAAHCVAEWTAEDLEEASVVAGITNRSDPRQTKRKIDQIYVHPNYTTPLGGFRNDIALLHVDKPFVFENNPMLAKSCIHRIDPPASTNQYPLSGTPLAVIGWGRLQQGIFSFPEMLQQVEVYAIDHEDPTCLRSINHTELQFCAGVIEGGKDSCQGDSGGPIFQWTGQYWEQVGITSYGFGCAQPGNLGIYTRLSYYYHWMEEILQSKGEHLEPSISSVMPTTTTIKPTTATSQPSTLSHTTSTEPPKEITYKCNRIPGQCGCSLTDVVFSTSNQPSMANILDRQDAFPYSWSMIVSVRVNGQKHSCGGTILSDSLILTAAQCVWHASNHFDITIAAGLHSLSEYPTLIRQVDRVHLHPSYVYDGRYLHDTAILHLDRPLGLSTQPLLAKTCVPDVDLLRNRYLLANSSLVVIGWGSSTVRGNLSDILQQVSVKLIDNQHTSCWGWISSPTYQFCAGQLDDGRVSCEGDVGGPIFMFKNNRWEQVGIVSNGHGCAEPGRPGRYTRLAAYVDWINLVMKNYTTTIDSGSYKHKQNVYAIGMLLLVVVSFF